jgi:hypothetical protein
LCVLFYNKHSRYLVVHFYLPLSWYSIAVCVLLQVVCVGILSIYCSPLYTHFFTETPTALCGESTVYGRGNPDGLVQMYAHQAQCRVSASSDGITLDGSAASILRCVCQCYLAGIVYSSYSLRPRGVGRLFRLRVTV